MENFFNKFKIKPMTKEQIIISADRLTRFKYTEEKYFRVFSEILTGHLILPKFKKSDIDKMDYGELTDIAAFIINFSLIALKIDKVNSGKINTELKKYENSVFNLDNNVQKFLENRINYDAIVELTKYSDVKNLQWLNSLREEGDRNVIREAHSLKYPLKTVIICEGITEETLLPEFAKIFGFDFDKNGVYVISAGGKNQVVKLFYSLADKLKLPIFVLLDSDAENNFNEILPRLRPFDKVHVIGYGEFEDILPMKLIEKTLKYDTANISLSDIKDIEPGKTVQFLTDFFRHRGLHEFKKAEFAASVKKNITCKTGLSKEIQEILGEITAVCS